MELLQWKESLAVGFAEIDAQHRELFQRANRFFATVGDSAGRNGLWAAFQRLDRFVRVHFAREERTMRWLGFPGLASHRTEHGDTLLRLDALRIHLASGGGPGAPLLDLGGALQADLVEHIRNADRSVAAYADSVLAG